MGETKSKELMVYDRRLLSRLVIYGLPIFVLEMAHMALMEAGLRRVSFWYLLVAYYLLLIVLSLRFMLDNWVIDFSCTEDGIETTSMFRGKKSVSWSTLRRFRRYPSGSFSTGTCMLFVEGRPVYRIIDMNPSQMDRLEELVRTYSDADVEYPRRR